MPAHRQVKVTWFNNDHEHRNELLRFGLMRLHRQGQLAYGERPLNQATRFGFSERISRRIHRHTSVILVQDGSVSVKCLVDSEDSFFFITEMVQDVDRYFCAGYSSQFFLERKFVPPYSWQTASEVEYYIDRADTLIREFGSSFNRVRKFVPIGPSLARKDRVSYFSQRMRNAHHKLDLTLLGGRSWLFRYQDFESRYRYLLELRNAPLEYDVVLVDTLWGWPRHRQKLHSVLKSLSERYEIHSCLNWSEPTEKDGGAERPLDKAEFPMCTGPVIDYESMLAASRLGVFAAGFHWGWRSVMSLALLFGLPVYSDPLILEPWFDMGQFDIHSNKSGDWTGVERCLAGISDAQWKETRTKTSANLRRGDGS